MNQSLSLTMYIANWMRTFKKDTVKTATLSRLQCSFNTLQNYAIARMPIGEITAYELQEYVNELTSDGYALSTIKKQMFIVAAPLKQAAAMHLIPADPTAGVRLPKAAKVKKKPRETGAYTTDEQDKLWAVITQSNNPAVHSIGIMLETGLRVNEMLALRWEFVSLERKRLYVEGTIINPVGKEKAQYQDSPKSESSRRMIPLTDRAIELLKRQEGLDDDWVFTGPKGGRLAYQNVLLNIRKACQQANVRYLGAHAFRHTFATNCYYRRMDVKLLSRLLGHNDIRVTMNIYVSLRDDGFDEMYAALNAI